MVLLRSSRGSAGRALFTRVTGPALLLCASCGQARDPVVLDPPSAESPEDNESPEDEPTPAQPSPSNCEALATGLGKERRVTTQGELDELAGCETFEGSLTIVTEQDLDLAPLESLRIVNGSFKVMAGSAREVNPINSHAPVIASLAGLDKLETVTGNMMLGKLRITTLSPLSRLRFQEEGRLSIIDCDELESLEGLASAPPQLELINDDRLTTLAPLRYGSATGMALLSNNPRLRDLTAFADLSEIGYLVLEAMPLESLAAFTNLRRVYELRLVEMSALVDLGALGNLEAARLLTIEGTSATELPELGKITALTGFSLANNPELIVGPRLPLVRESLDDNYPPAITIRGNAKLERLDGFEALERAEAISVSGNPQLSSVTFDALTSIRSFFYIEDNAELESVSLPRLEALDILTVVQNPALPSTSLESLRALAREAFIDGNAGED